MNVFNRLLTSCALCAMLYSPMIEARKKHKKKALPITQYSISQQEQTTSPEELINQFLRPVVFTQDGLKSFMRAYNSSFYVDRFLPACFIHIIDFLEYGQCQEKNGQYFLSILALFTQRIQACEWVNPYAYLALLERMNEILATYCMHLEEKDPTPLVELELKQAFIENFNLLQTEPENFIKQTAEKITKAASFGNTQFIIRELQAAIMQLLLSANNKLIWHPREKIDSCRMLFAIANQYQSLFESHLISSYEDLNLLIWSLLYRYGFFIECAGSQLHPDVYKTIQTELAERKHSFILLREQETEMTTKENYLLSTLMKGLTRSEAYSAGLKVDKFI